MPGREEGSGLSREEVWWGTGTARASDSRKFGARPGKLRADAEAEGHRLRAAVPAGGQDDNWPNLGPVLSVKTIDRDLNAQQYDQIVKYTTAPRLGAAEAEQVLRRFTRGGLRRPAPCPSAARPRPRAVAQRHMSVRRGNTGTGR
ncbi:hypothetical protein [Streptomyces sp. NPDC014623]|uniref:hypothetical protein n=1 Tax=Streptomyces sp. NPDC014623 TaxID=3364875 RepID=UPI003702E0EB